MFKKITFNYPLAEYKYLKLASEKKGISIDVFITRSVMKTIDEYEDELWLAKKAKEENESVIKYDLPT